MNDLDSLSNNELRLLLLEYGLANMPVTVNTRRSTVTKLRNHLGNKRSILSKKSSNTIDSKTGKSALIGDGDPVPSDGTASTSISNINVQRSDRIACMTELALTEETDSSVPSNVPAIFEGTDEKLVIKKAINWQRSKLKSHIGQLSKPKPVLTSLRHIIPMENVVEHEKNDYSIVFSSSATNDTTSTTCVISKFYSENDAEHDGYDDGPVIEENIFEKGFFNTSYTSTYALNSADGDKSQFESNNCYTHTIIESPFSTGRHPTDPKSYSVPIYQQSNSDKNEETNWFLEELRYEWSYLNAKFQMYRNLAILFILLFTIFLMVFSFL